MRQTPRAFRWTAAIIAFGVLQLLLMPGTLAAADLKASGPSLLKNGDCEQGQAGIPLGWTHGRIGKAIFRWEPAGGIDNSRCLSIAISGPAADAAWVQKLTLEPRTAYRRPRFQGIPASMHLDCIRN